MADIIRSFNTFPGNTITGLALLYMQKQNLTGDSPEEITTKYFEAMDRIKSQIQIEVEKRNN